MRKIKLFIETGYAGCEHEEIIEVEDSVTDDELDSMAEDFCWNYINYGWLEEE